MNRQSACNGRMLALVGAALALVGLSGAARAQAAASPYTSATRYDLMGRVTGTIAPNSLPTGIETFAATRTTYDLAGRPVKVETGYLAGWQPETVAPADWTGFTAVTVAETTYNEQDAKLSERVKGWTGTAWATYSLTQFKYDAAGRLQCTALRMNPAVYDSITADACTPFAAGEHDPDRITRNVYDGAGQLVQVREGVGSTAASLGGAVEAAEVTYAYTLNGKIAEVIDAAGNRALRCYDRFDRQVRWVFPSPTALLPGVFDDSSAGTALATAGAASGACTGTAPGWDYEEYGYDGNSNRTSLRKRDGAVLTYQYDKLNRMTAKLVPERASGWCRLSIPQYPNVCDTHTRDVHYTYDLHGLMTSARFDSPSGEGVTFTYDGFGRKTSETLTMDGVPRTLGSGYDRNGRRVQLTYPGGTYVYYHGHQTGQFYYATLSNSITLFHVRYDDFGRPTGMHRWSVASATWEALASGFDYDPVSRLSALTLDLGGDASDTATFFTRNPAGQLAGLTRSNDAYAWQGAANAEDDYVTNGLNQYANVESLELAYDANGNLTSDGVSSYTYDLENRLIGRLATSSSTFLRYDPLGRLYEVYDSATGYTRFLYDGDALVAEYGGTQSATTMPLLRRYVHGPAEGVDDPLVWFEGPGTTDPERRYLFADERGSIVAWSDANGAAGATNKYDEYGRTNIALTNDTETFGRFRFTGQAYIPELGMYHYKARIYSPVLGRFLQTDPIGYDDQFNLYAYVGNDPVNGIDPTGTELGCITLNTGCGLNAEGNGVKGETAIAIGAAIISIAIDLSNGDAPGTTARSGVAVAAAARAARQADGVGDAAAAARVSKVGPGPNARDSIPAGPSPRPDAAQQRQINEMGRRDGCHSCGSRNPGTKSGNFVGDHQPANKLNPTGGAQRYYPHCQRCSDIQGGRLRHIPAPAPPSSRPWWKFWK